MMASIIVCHPSGARVRTLRSLCRCPRLALAFAVSGAARQDWGRGASKMAGMRNLLSLMVYSGLKTMGVGPLCVLGLRRAGRDPRVPGPAASAWLHQASLPNPLYSQV